MNAPKDITAFQSGSPFGENEDEAFKAGEAAKHDLGVLYQGPWETQADGFNEHTRRCARALAMVGVPVHLRGFGPSVQFGIARGTASDVAPLVHASIARYSVQIQQIVLSIRIAQYFVRHKFLGEEELALLNRYRVVSSVFECDRVSPDIIEPLKSVAQIWVACQANVNMLERCGLDRAKIRVVPVPHFDDDPLLTMRGRTRRKGVPRFYHIGKWEPRKAQDKIVLAFMKAFRPGEAHLILKTSAWKAPSDGTYPQSAEIAIESALQSGLVDAKWTDTNWKNSIEIVSARLSSAEMLMLHKFGDIYVTLSRGEGYDMPAFDATLAGNRLVYTPSGGPQDFAASDDFPVPTTGTIPCHPFYQWVEGARYLDFDVEAAADAMRKAAHRVESSRPNVSPRHRAQDVGENMLRNLREIVGKEGKVY